MTDCIVVTINDARAAGLCSAGGRAFAARHGLDWLRFLHEGLPAADLLKLDDAMAVKAVDAARERLRRG